MSEWTLSPSLFSPSSATSSSVIVWPRFTGASERHVYLMVSVPASPW